MIHRYRFIFMILAAGLSHQFVQKVLNIPIRAIDNYFDDLIAIPFIMGITLFIEKEVFGKEPSYFHSVSRIIAVSVFISILFELLLPLYSVTYVSDPIDILCYLSGALIYFLIQRQMQQELNRAQL